MTNTPHSAITAAVTALFVPGDSPERFSKAQASGADLVIIDLEDAVSPTTKAEALRNTVEALDNSTELTALVRINGIGTATHEDEVAALLRLASRRPHGLLGLMIPKAEGGADFQNLATACAREHLAVVGLVESASGVLTAPQIASSAGVTRLAFGALDYAVDVGTGTEDRYLDYARSALVVASRAAGIAAPIDSPSVDIRNVEKIHATARLARGFGFRGKLCIHPAQVEPTKSAFSPDAQEIQWARTVIRSTTGATQVNGTMVDKPVIDRARQILALVEKESADPRGQRA